MIKFGNLKKVELRSIWPNEAYDFTPWLAKNLDSLGGAIGKELEFSESEASAGDFSVDILARDLGTGHPVVIENQFGNTDHDHLGKLLTYASGFDAGIVIWIAESLREEHRQALEWLNQRTNLDTQFFGVIIEILQIDDSQPVYNFKPVVFPNEWRKSQKSKTEKALSSRAEAYQGYFQKLIDILREKYSFTGARVGQPQNWYSFASRLSGLSGITYGTSFALGSRVRAELYIDQGDAEENRHLFEYLMSDKEQIEQGFGEPFEWEPLDEKRACRIAVYRPGSIENSEEVLDEIRNWAIDRLLKLKKVFEPHLRRYGRERKRGVNGA